MADKYGPEDAPILKQKNLSGAMAGRQARFKVLDRMIKRRQMIKNATKGSPGGKVRSLRGDMNDLSGDVDSMIRRST